MSFDLYFQPAVHGELLEISRSDLRSLFPIIEEESQADYWSIRYDTVNGCHIGVKALPCADGSPSSSLLSFHVEKPCADQRLWEALFNVLKKCPIVWYFPGGPPIVARAGLRATLPEDVIGSLGEPRCVNSAADILKIVHGS
jgi:hypothetical protein